MFREGVSPEVVSLELFDFFVVGEKAFSLDLNDDLSELL